MATGTVTRLARAVEPVLFIAGRWEAWHHVLGTGLEAARATADNAAEALFSHQLGSLAFCQDRLDDAVRHLRHALTLREQIGDRDGAALTRGNLRLLDPPPPPRLPRVSRRAWRALAGVAGAVTLIAGAAAVAGALLGGAHEPVQPAGNVSSTATPSTTSPSASPSPSPSPSPDSGQGSSSSPTSSPTNHPSSRLVPDVIGISPAAAAR